MEHHIQASTLQQCYSHRLLMLVANACQQNMYLLSPV